MDTPHVSSYDNISVLPVVKVNIHVEARPFPELWVPIEVKEKVLYIYLHSIHSGKRIIRNIMSTVQNYTREEYFVH